MASTTGDREIKLVKADGPQFVQRNDKLQGTKAVEPNNATSPHEVEVPSLDRLDLNENSNGAIEDFSDDAWLRKLLYGEGKRRGTMKWKRLLPSSDADLSSLRNCLIDPSGEALNSSKFSDDEDIL